jgi:DNA polymerase (family 10)
MGAKKETLILRAIEERQRETGRHLLSDTSSASAELVAHLRVHAPAVEFIPVGSLRRGCETCGDIDILAVGGDPALMDVFVGYPQVERVLGHGATKSSVLLRGGYQADLRLVAAESRGAAMQYFTGSKAHNIVLRDRAIQQGFKLNEYGLFRTDYRIAGDFEYCARIFHGGGLVYRSLPETLVRMRTGGISTSGWRNTILLNREVLRACRENGIETNLLKILSKYPAKLLEFLVK